MTWDPALGNPGRKLFTLGVSEGFSEEETHTFEGQVYGKERRKGIPNKETAREGPGPGNRRWGGEHREHCTQNPPAPIS